jgi:transposase-like protein
LGQNTLQAPIREAVRETVTEVIQLLLDLLREAFLRENGVRKNGHYRRTLQTRFGQVDLSITRDREGRYYPSFFIPYQRGLVEVGEVAIALDASALSHRKAAEILVLLLGHRYSHETLSALTDQVLEAAESSRRRPLPPGDGLRLPGRPVPQGLPGGRRGAGRRSTWPRGSPRRGNTGCWGSGSFPQRRQPAGRVCSKS